MEDLRDHRKAGDTKDSVERAVESDRGVAGIEEEDGGCASLGIWWNSR